MTAIDEPFVPDLTEFHIAPTLGGTLSAATEVPKVADLGSLDSEKAIIEYSSFGDAYKSKASGKKNVADWTIQLNRVVSDAQQQAIKTAFDSDTSIFVSLVWKHGVENARADMEVIVSSWKIPNPEEDIQTVEVVLGIVGGITFDDTTDALLNAW
jgi:hypothetical protein